MKTNGPRSVSIRNKSTGTWQTEAEFLAGMFFTNTGTSPKRIL